MKLTVKKPITIEDGAKQGACVAVEYRSKPFDYADFVLEFLNEKENIRLKASYPLTISQGSKLGKLLARFGFNIEPEKTIELDDMIGKKVAFTTITEETSNGTFGKVVQDSLKPTK